MVKFSIIYTYNVPFIISMHVWPQWYHANNTTVLICSLLSYLLCVCVLYTTSCKKCHEGECTTTNYLVKGEKTEYKTLYFGLI